MNSLRHIRDQRTVAIVVALAPKEAKTVLSAPNVFWGSQVEIYIEYICREEPNGNVISMRSLSPLSILQIARKRIFQVA